MTGAHANCKGLNLDEISGTAIRAAVGVTGVTNSQDKMVNIVKNTQNPDCFSSYQLQAEKKNVAKMLFPLTFITIFKPDGTHYVMQLCW